MQTTNSKKLANEAKKKRGLIKAKRKFFEDVRYGLTLTEHRIIYYIILTGQQSGKPFMPVTMTVKEFQAVCGLSGESTYHQLLKITGNLVGKSVEVIYKDKDGSHLMQTTWVNGAVYHEKTGTVTITPNPMLKPFFNNPQKDYSTTEFYFLVKFTCQYSERLYELLKSLNFKTIVDFDIEDLRLRLGVESKDPRNRKSPL